MDIIQNLLTQVNLLIKKNEEILDATGGRFNIFEILGISHYETTHSGILAEFLNPLGSHGLKEKFLNCFINQSCFSDIDIKKFNCRNAIVTTEKYAGEYGRMDIVIEDLASNNAIIIENKLDAQDQKAQLERYREYAEKHYHKYWLIYLTFDGRNASNQSAGSVQYISISYKTEIIQWLENCVYISANYPTVRETLNQYIYFLKQITGQDMDTKSKKEIVNLMIANQENKMAVVEIIKNREEWVRLILKQCCEEIGRQLPTNLEMNAEDLDRITFKKNNWEKFDILLYYERNHWHLGLNGAQNEPFHKKLECFHLGWLNWPYGLNRFPYVYEDFINGNFCRLVISNINRILECINDEKIEL